MRFVLRVALTLGWCVPEVWGVYPLGSSKDFFLTLSWRVEAILLRQDLDSLCRGVLQNKTPEESVSLFFTHHDGLIILKKQSAHEQSFVTVTHLCCTDGVRDDESNSDTLDPTFPTMHLICAFHQSLPIGAACTLSQDWNNAGSWSISIYLLSDNMQHDGRTRTICVELHDASSLPGRRARDWQQNINWQNRQTPWC